MIGVPAGLGNQLAASWDETINGRGSVHIFRASGKSFFEPVTGLLANAAGFSRDSLVEFDPISDRVMPFSPLSDIVSRGLPKECGLEALLDELRIYPRHRELWASLLSGTPYRERESVIAEELHQESLFFRRDMGILLGRVCARVPCALVCHHAEFLPQEILEILTDRAVVESTALMVLLCFCAEPSGAEPTDMWESYYLDRLSDGQVIDLGGDEGSDDAIVQDPRDAAILSPASFPFFLDFLHFGTLIRWARRCWQTNNQFPGTLDPEAELIVLETLARAYEGIDDFDSALFFAQLLWSELMNQDSSERKIRSQCLLARLFLGKNDHETALRSALSAWKLLTPESSLRERAETEFVLFLLNPHDGSYPEIFTPLEPTLLGDLAELGWSNHLSFILTQNFAVTDIYVTKGYAEALDRVTRGIALAQSEGNARRLGTAYKILGGIEQMRGNCALAERAFLDSRDHLLSIARDFEIARNENGLGYFYFSRGDYAHSYRCHAHALELLYRSKKYEEICSTLFNLGRVYLFNGQAQHGFACLESMVKIMNSLQITHLPFHPRRNIYSLMGICSLLLGRLSQALDFDRHLGEIGPADESNYGCDYQVWFNCLKAERLETRERVESEYARVAEVMEGRGNESRDVLLRLLLDWALYAESRGETEGARKIRVRALGISRLSGGHEAESAWLESTLSGAPPPARIVFPPPQFDSEIVLQFVAQDSNLKRLQRKINELGFLQAWQDCLRQENKRDEIIHKCTSLLARHFMADEVDFFEIVNQEEGSTDDEMRLCMVQGDPVNAQERALFIIDRYREWGPRFGYWEDAGTRRAGSYLPITYMGRTRFILWAMGNPRSMTDEVHRVLVTAAWQMTAALELLTLQEKLLKAATIDALTGLANRSEFLRRLDYYFKMAKRLGPIPKQEFCVLFMDLDNFKHVNDTWGHNAGDLMLKLFSETVGKILRSTDLVCRYGGDEFMALLPATDVEGATITAERILAGLRFKNGYAAELSRFLGETVSFPEGKELSCSIGVTEYDAARDDRIETIIARADEAAYCAKKGGKGQYKVS